MTMNENDTDKFWESLTEKEKKSMLGAFAGLLVDEMMVSKMEWESLKGKFSGFMKDVYSLDFYEQIK